jgi:uncharacterized membrane-anchored protein
MTTPNTPPKISIADVNFPLPIEVLYSEQANVVLGARLMVSADEGVDLATLLEEDDWEHLSVKLMELGYLKDDDAEKTYQPTEDDSNNS